MRKDQLERVRRICSTLPETTEKLSHGEPTFFVKNKVFVMFADNHHNDGHIAVWLPVPSGFQTTLIESAPETFFKPPYVGVRGWVGIELDRIMDKDLTYHIEVAWELIAPKRLLASVKAKDTSMITQK
ncbi:MAG TPA: MmcQ/YjbR family DNA-binding protein [Anaerolineales bacterium]|nr:MmcQ/YjbR family DNA-binding protein [Anaerolineales bacterium]